MSCTEAVKRLLYGLVVSAGLLLLPGCGLFLSTPGPLTELDAPRKTELTTVPFFPQGDDLCGPASMSMMMNHRGRQLTPGQLEPLIYVPGKRGALQAEMMASARRFGFVPYVIEPELTALINEVAAGNPVLVLQNLGLGWLPKWHYAVVIGYDIERDEITLHSGITERLVMSSKRFMHHWRGSSYWAMVTSPPDRLPTTARELPYLESVASLERLGQWATIETAYESALGKWSKSFYAHLGTGTAAYHLGKLHKAREYYEAAVDLKPSAAVAHNNLAQVLLELGKNRLALRHARKAVSLDGQAIDSYRETLRQVEAAINR